MEQKLKEFKRKRRRELLMNKPKEFLLKIINKIIFKRDISCNTCETESLVSSDASSTNNFQVLEDEVSATSDDMSVSQVSNSWLDVIINFLYFILWVITYIIAIHAEFGFVYLVLSGLAFIYYNTRTSPKRKGELSAYSVFNPGCEAIEGTLKLEQLEREFNLIQH